MHNSNGFPLVSICVPLYNHARFIQGCLRSIINQSYLNIELVVINDGSKDDSDEKVFEIYDECKKRFVRFEFIHRENRGLCSTLNEALEWCQGEYFATIASDDLMLPLKTEILVTYLEANSECVAAFGGMEIIDESGKVVGSRQQQERSFDFRKIYLHEHFLPAPTQLIRLKNLKAVGGYDPNIIIEDWYMWNKLSLQGGVLTVLSDILVQYRRHEGNLSKRFDLMHKGRLQVIEYFKQNELYAKAKARVFYMSAKERLVGSKYSALKFYFKAVVLDPALFFSWMSVKFLVAFFVPSFILRRVSR